MSNAWAVVVAALGSSTLTIAGSFWLEQWRLRKAAKAASLDRLREACAQLGTHAFLFALRAQVLYQTAVIRSGIREGSDIALYHRRPADPMSIADWLAIDFKPMVEAFTIIEISGDRDLIHAASKLLAAAASVSEKASSVTRRSITADDSRLKRIAQYVQALVPLRPNPETEEDIRETVAELARNLREFNHKARIRLGVNDPDAILRAFPGLLPCTAEPEPKTSEKEQDANVGQP